MPADQVQSNGAPLVSIMMPCYNARESLPWAIASCLAQTYANWELVLVDDGSTDSPYDIVEEFNDQRIKYIRIMENKGRGHARQVALDNASGSFLCMLDADDWMFPDRIASQLQVMESEPKVGLVSSGMAIVGDQNEIEGVRSKGDGVVRGPHRSLRSPVAHAPSLYRRSLIKDAKFDPLLVRGQDQDFLHQILNGRFFCTLPHLAYVYSELTSESSAKAILSQKYARIRFRKYLRNFPMEGARLILESYAKEAGYRLAAISHRSDEIIRNRSQAPSVHDKAEFISAKNTVERVWSSFFGGKGP